jgi:mRNA-degrading endonuclease RelE of RelBE toxin-antitoxin system
VRDGFQVELPKRVRKEKRDLPVTVLARVLEAISDLQNNPFTSKVQIARLRRRSGQSCRLHNFDAIDATFES